MRGNSFLKPAAAVKSKFCQANRNPLSITSNQLSDKANPEQTTLSMANKPKNAPQLLPATRLLAITYSAQPIFLNPPEPKNEPKNLERRNPPTSPYDRSTCSDLLNPPDFPNPNQRTQFPSAAEPPDDRCQGRNPIYSQRKTADGRCRSANAPVMGAPRYAGCLALALSKRVSKQVLRSSESFAILIGASLREVHLSGRQKSFGGICRLHQ